MLFIETETLAIKLVQPCLGRHHAPLRHAVGGRSVQYAAIRLEEGIIMPKITWNWQPSGLLWGTFEGIDEHFQEITDITGEVVR